MTVATLTLNEVLSRLMFEKKIRTAELARQTNIPQPTVQRMVRGNTPNPHQSTLQAIADYFNISINQLKGLEPIPWLLPQSPDATGWVKIPLLSWEQAINWNGCDENLKESHEIFTDAKLGLGAFALRMHDASMEPIFPKGTTLIIDPSKTPKDRSYVVALLKNYTEAIFRQLIINGPHRYLKPISPDFEHFKMSKIDKDDKIIGILVQTRRDYED